MIPAIETKRRDDELYYKYTRSKVVHRNVSQGCNQIAYVGVKRVVKTQPPHNIIVALWDL